MLNVQDQEVLNLNNIQLVLKTFGICFPSSHSDNKFSTQLEYITCMLEATVEQLWPLHPCGQLRDSLALTALM